MQFEYEINADEYIACQLLYYRLSAGRKRIERAICWILAGIFFIIVAWNEKTLNWAPVLLAFVGVWWMYAGVMNVFPSWHFRRQYRGAKLAGKKFQADVNEQGFEVAGGVCGWRVRWIGVPLKAENEQAFMFYSEGTSTIFMFGKQYLSDEQQRELRKLAELTSA